MIALLALVVWLSGPAPGDPVALAWLDEQPVAGTRSGLFSPGPSGWERRAPGEVRGLAVVGDALWIASSRGLHSWRRGGRVRPVPLGAGARVRGVAASAGRVWAATEVGLFSGDAAGFTRERALPPGEVHAVAAAGGEIWVARRGALWRVSAGRAELAARALGDGWWELRAAVAHAGAVWLVVPAGLWRAGEGPLERVEVPVAGELRDALPVGEELWVAAARGVYALAPDARSSPRPQLHVDARALLGDGRRTLVLARRGLAELAVELARTPGSPPTSRRAGPGLAPAPRPVDVRTLQRAALAHQGLEPERLRAVERRARRAGWLPQLRAGARWDRGSTRERDHDQTFSSGEVRRLLDLAHDRDRGVQLDVDLVWDLPRLAAPGDAIDVSRERRLVVELRDQVLERVNRLYFERERVRRTLAAAGPSPEATAAPGPRPEAATDLDALRLRERELTAQLDAWTGGAASRLELDSPPVPRRGR